MSQTNDNGDDGRTELEIGDTSRPGPDELIVAEEFVQSAQDGQMSADDAAKLALGELAAYDVRSSGTPVVADIKEQLQGVLLVDDGEKAHFVNQAADLLESALAEYADEAAESAAEERPPDCVRWTEAEMGVLELPVSRPLVEWMELEAGEDNFDSVEEWALTQLKIRLSENLDRKYGFTHGVDIDVPEPFARRMALWKQAAEAEGRSFDVPDRAFNHLSFDFNWVLDGEPWDLAEQAYDDE